MSTRGYINNNPGNIRQSDTKWQGESERDLDSAFEEFESMVYGYRALIKTLQTYIANGYNTIEKIISRWAPPIENDTEAYINAVVKKVAIVRTQSFGSNDWDKLRLMALAISKHENGINANESEVDEAIAMIQGTKKKLRQ